MKPMKIWDKEIPLYNPEINNTENDSVDHKPNGAPLAYTCGQLGQELHIKETQSLDWVFLYL